MEKKFKNKYGEIPAGTEVSFKMENADMWAGDTKGILMYEDDKWFIRTKNTGDIGIGGYLEAYPGTISPLNTYSPLLNN